MWEGEGCSKSLVYWPSTIAAAVAQVENHHSPRPENWCTSFWLPASGIFAVLAPLAHPFLMPHWTNPFLDVSPRSCFFTGSVWSSVVLGRLPVYEIGSCCLSCRWVSSFSQSCRDVSKPSLYTTGYMTGSVEFRLLTVTSCFRVGHSANYLGSRCHLLAEIATNVVSHQWKFSSMWINRVRVVVSSCLLTLLILGNNKSEFKNTQVRVTNL